MPGGRLRHGDARIEDVKPGDLAWILALPFVLVGVALVLLGAPLLGDLAFPRPSFHYWRPDVIVRKPATQAGYLLALGIVAVYAGAVLVVSRRGLRIDAAWRRALVLATQLLAVALVVVAWIVQRDLEVLGRRRAYFTPATIVAAAAFTGVAAALLAPRGRRLLRAIRERLPRPGPRALGAACFAGALLAVVVWTLPAVYTDIGLSVLGEDGALALPSELFGNIYYFGEATAVLNGRSPLVDMPAYGSVWPYVVALPFGALDGTYAAYSALMAGITGAALLAIYDVLRRVAGSVAALLLFVPFVAASCFLEVGDNTWRYDPSTYFGVFPLRYAGPYLLAWLTARHIARRRGDGASVVLLFAFAGLVAANNLDFGLSALAATVVALLAARRPLRPGRLAGQAAAGLALALALLSALTLLRAGSLPRLDMLTQYGRVFVSGGYGNVELPGFGWHLALTLTFVGAVLLAAVRIAARERDLLTAMLAWTGVFGLGASVYFYAYRSYPDVLINLFSIWALTLALLVVAVVRSSRASGRAPALAGLLVLFGFGLAACSVAQLPLPWFQVERIASEGANRPFVVPGMAAAVAARTDPGEHVLLLVPLGHRVAREAGVVNVSPYPAFGQMPAREQLDEALAMLRTEHGRTVFVGHHPPPGLVAHLRREGFAQVARLPDGGWAGEPILVLRRRSP